MADHRGQCWRKHAWMARPLWWGVPSAPAYWDLMYQGGTAISLTTLEICGSTQQWVEDGFENLEIRGVPTIWDTCPAFLPQAQIKYRHVWPEILKQEWPDHSPVDVTDSYDVSSMYSDVWCGPFILWDGELREEREYSQTNQVMFSLFPDGKILENDPYGIVQGRSMCAPWEVLNVDYTDTALVNEVQDELDYVRDRIMYAAISEDPFELSQHVELIVDAMTTVPAIKTLLNRQAQDWAHMLEGRNDPCSSSQLQQLQRLRWAS